MTTTATYSPNISAETLQPRDEPMDAWSPNVAILGRAGAGKTTGADYLVREHGYTKASFAYLLKQMAVEIWGESAQYDRHALQTFGQAVRELDADAWVNALELDLSKRRGPIVVDDCRMVNEYNMLYDRNFKFIRVQCDEHIRERRLIANGKFQNREQLQHITETASDIFGSDYTVYNMYSGVEAYEEQVRLAVEHLRRGVA